MLQLHLHYFIIRCVIHARKVISSLKNDTFLFDLLFLDKRPSYQWLPSVYCTLSRWSGSTKFDRLDTGRMGKFNDSLKISMKLLKWNAWMNVHGITCSGNIRNLSKIAFCIIIPSWNAVESRDHKIGTKIFTLIAHQHLLALERHVVYHFPVVSPD